MKTYHIPAECGYPVHYRVHTTNKLQVLGVGYSLFNEVHSETGGNERHGKYHTNSYHNIAETLVPEIYIEQLIDF